MEKLHNAPIILILLAIFLLSSTPANSFAPLPVVITKKTEARSTDKNKNEVPPSNEDKKNGGNISVKSLTATDAEISFCYAIRSEVFIQEQQVPADIEMDSNDETATHILARCEDGEPCGAARLVIVTEEGTKKKVGKIGRVCVLSSHRRHGIGRKIVEFAIEELRRLLGSGSKAKLGAQVHALSFYESMGFELIEGEEYLDAGGVFHRDMELVL